ncbi:MAG TPA: DUF4097 family beta strand repeat-containing protein [Mycobacteriales bacterium]
MPDYTFDTPQPVDLRIRAASGTVSVTAADTTTSTVEVTPLDDSARDLAENTAVRLDGDRLTVEMPERLVGFSLRRRRVDITITVPTGSSLTSRTASARVTATGRYAAATVNTASGQVSLDTVDGDAEVHCASGDVTIGSARATRVHSASGQVRIDRAGGDIEVHSASGQIRIGVAEGSVNAKTASGDITVEDARTGTVSLNAASGDLHIGVRAGVTAHLDVSSVSGRIRSDLPVNDAAPDSGASLDVRARTVSGNVVIAPASVRTTL